MTFLSLTAMGLVGGCAIRYNYAKDSTCGRAFNFACGINEKYGLKCAVKAVKGWTVNKSDKRSGYRFLFDSKSFYAGLLCFIVFVCACSFGDFSGSSGFVKTGTIITTLAILSCASYIGVKRWNIYKKGIDKEETQSHWETSKREETKQIGNKLIPTVFFIILLTGLVLFFCAASGGHFSGSGTSALFTTLALVSIGGYGFYKTYGGFCKTSEGLLEYCHGGKTTDTDNKVPETKPNDAEGEVKPMTSLKLKPQNSVRSEDDAKRAGESEHRRRLSALERRMRKQFC